MELVEGVRPDSKTEEDGKKRSRKSDGVDVDRHGSADCNVREVPHRVRKVKERDQVTSPAAGCRIESTSSVCHDRRPHMTIPPPSDMRR